ncbi:MAG: glycerol kinase GlpK [bacterium]
MSYLMAIDQGTSSSRALVFDDLGRRVSVAQHPFKQYYPQSGWVEHDANEIWETTLRSTQEAISTAGIKAVDIAAVGITNQRETIIVWDRSTGEPIHHALVWQDRRTADFCQSLKDNGLEPTVHDKTGLVLDPYFSASKLKWLLDNVEGAREKANRGELAAGTIDAFLLWRFTGGKSHLTDATNASRTMLYNIHNGGWDDELLTIFDIPRSVLPEVRDNCDHFGDTEPSLLDASLPIRAMIGDQQSALVGQACFERGSGKSTYGTGCFLMVNTGEEPVASSCKMLTTVAYRLDGKTHYALEGSIFNAGTVVQWLRDEMDLIDSAAESELVAQSTKMLPGVYLIPAFTGLGAPHWNPNVRGTLTGLTRDTDKAQVVTAGLLSVAYQTRDLMEAVRQDLSGLNILRVDGGMSRNNWLMQQLANQLNLTIARPVETETTALGAAYLAGLGAGYFQSTADIADAWQVDRQFSPAQSDADNDAYSGWQQAVAHLLRH